MQAQTRCVCVGDAKHTWKSLSCVHRSDMMSQLHSETAWQPASPSHESEATDAGNGTVTNSGTEPR